jgi:hypothetical protein
VRQQHAGVFGQPWGVTHEDDLDEIVFLDDDGNEITPNEQPPMGAPPLFRPIATGDRVQEIPLSQHSITAILKQTAKEAGATVKGRRRT